MKKTHNGDELMDETLNQKIVDANQRKYKRKDKQRDRRCKKAEKERERQEKIRRKKSRLNDKESHIKKVVISVGIIMATSGIIVSGGAFFVKALLMPYEWLSKMEILPQAVGLILDLGINLGFASITLGVGTIIYNFFDLVSYIRLQIQKVILDNDFTDIMSEGQKRKLVRKLEAELANVKDEYENDLFSFVQEEVLSILKLPHYDKLELDCGCVMTEDGRIEKTVTKNYQFNCKNCKDFKLSEFKFFKFFLFDKYDEAEIISLSISDSKGKKILELNGEDFNFFASFFKMYDEMENVDNKEIPLSEVDLTKYDNCYKIIIPKLKSQSVERIDEIKNDPDWDGIYRVKSVNKTIVNKRDLTFTARVPFPSRKSLIVFHYDENSFSLSDDVFVFKDTAINGVAEDITYSRMKGNTVISIEDWILPGDGVSFVLFEKEKDSTILESVGEKKEDIEGFSPEIRTEREIKKETIIENLAKENLLLEAEKEITIIDLNEENS